MVPFTVATAQCRAQCTLHSRTRRGGRSVGEGKRAHLSHSCFLFSTSGCKIWAMRPSLPCTLANYSVPEHPHNYLKRAASAAGSEESGGGGFRVLSIPGLPPPPPSNLLPMQGALICFMLTWVWHRSFLSWRKPGNVRFTETMLSL